MRQAPALRFALAVVALFASRAHGAEPRVHTVFCAECSNNFDYKSLGVYYSHALSGMHGNVTRLLACDPEQLKMYKGLDLGPTFVHKNHGRIIHHRDESKPAPFGSRKTDSSPSYNKPGSIMHWVLEAEEAKHVDYVLYIDADMLLRLPMDPVKMGVKPGVVVSEHVGYLDTGLKAGLQFEFLSGKDAKFAGDDVNDHSPTGPMGKKHAAGGWYHFFHIDDIRKIARRWYDYEEQFRLNPQKYWKMVDPQTGRPGGVDHDIATGDAYVSHGTAPWISEMYGYVFASAEANLRHILTHGVVVYPDEIGAGQPNEPSIIHYGLHCTVGKFHFTKYTHGSFNAVGCTGEVFGDPPKPTHLERLCAETVLTLNDAMCAYYDRPKAHGGCALESFQTCPAWKAPAEAVCKDKDAMCPTWAKSGECTNNPGFMLGSCPKSCDGCEPQGAHEVPAWRRAIALSHGGVAPPMREVPAGHAPAVISTSHGDGMDHVVAGGAGTKAASALSVGEHLRTISEHKKGRELAIEGHANARPAVKPSSHVDIKPSTHEAVHEAMPTRKFTADVAASDEKADGTLPPLEDTPDGPPYEGKKSEQEERETSLGELKSYMYVAWFAILALCSVVVGRRFCGRKRSRLPKGSRAV